MAPRDTFTGVGVGRKTGSEAGEAIRWGHLFPGDFASVFGGNSFAECGLRWLSLRLDTSHTPHSVLTGGVVPGAAHRPAFSAWRRLRAFRLN